MGFGRMAWFVGGAVAAFVLTVGAQDVARVTVQGGGCAPTPAGAIRLARGEQAGLLPSQRAGYRVRTVRWDAVQGQGWAVVESCAHPEQPAMAMLTDLPVAHPVLGPEGIGTAAAGVAAGVEVASGVLSSAAVIRANAAVVVVKAGDVVRLWKRDGRAAIELVATAEENGIAGARVRVRLMTPKEADGQTAPPRFLAGTVRGPADVEMEP